MKPRNFPRAVCLVISLLCTGAQVEASSIYTCTDAKGRQSFSDRPCPAGAEQGSKKPAQITSPNQPAGKRQRKATGGYGGFVNRARGVEKKLDKKP